MDMSSKKCVTQQGDEKGFGGGKKIIKKINRHHPKFTERKTDHYSSNYLV